MAVAQRLAVPCVFAMATQRRRGRDVAAGPFVDYCEKRQKEGKEKRKESVVAGEAGNGWASLAALSAG